MPTRKTYPFLPDYFQTETNKKFLNATLDQLTTEPNVKTINGYVGRKFAPGNTDINGYIREPNLTRANYQLEPGIVVKDPITGNVTFSVTYPEFLQKLNYLNANIADPNKLFDNTYYNFDPHVNSDAIINFGNYYWLPSGPDPVSIFANTTELTRNFYISTDVSRQTIAINGFGNIDNPEITLVRGGVYSFVVNQRNYPLWLQTDPGTSGLQINNNNLSSREILGVANNGDDIGVVTFAVPTQTAQDQFINMPILQNVDLATTLTYSQIQGQALPTVVGNYNGIDGQRNNLEGKYIIFTTNSKNDADWTAGSTTVPASQRYGIWKVSFTESGGINYFNLIFYAALPLNNKVIITSGISYGNTQWYTNPDYEITRIPNITANLDTLYYQIGNVAGAVGTIKIVDPSSNVINVETEILGKIDYQSPNGVRFTNGLKIKFDSSVTPASYQNNEYYVEQVGIGIRLVSVNTLIFNPTQIASNYDPTTAFTESANATLAGTKDSLTITSNVTPVNALTGTFPNLYNPNAIVAQDLVYNFPYRGGQNTQGAHDSIVYRTGTIGTTLPGIPLYGASTGWSVPGTNGTAWTLLSPEAKVNGEDTYGGLPDSNGVYHYTNSDFITANAWGNVTGFTDGYTSTDGHSKIIGFAEDGYPIYGPFGYLNPGDPASPVVRMTSSYTSSSAKNNRPEPKTVTLTGNTTSNSYITVSSTFGINPGMRITVNDAGLTENAYWVINNGLATATGPDIFPGGPNQVQLNSNVTVTANATITFEYLPGVFIEDWDYQPSTGSLDEYNGRFCITPEYPAGTYAYFATQDITNAPKYPYFVGRAFYGSTSIDINTALLEPDYITINRSSKDINAWSRRNRWFHRDVLEKTAVYNSTAFTVDPDAKAKRPIVEFEPDIQLYNFGKIAKTPVDLIDTTTVEPFISIEGKTGVFVDGTYLAEGMRIIFAADQDDLTRNKIWQVTFIDQDADANTAKIIHLIEPSDSTAVEYDTIAVLSGTNNASKIFWYNGTNWVEGQTKTSINQAPLFDVFDSVGISLSDVTKYPISNQSLSFTGTKLFGYVEGTGTADSILGFPLSYQSFNNIGDIQFKNYYGSDTFLYSIDGTDYTKNINIGFLHKNISYTTYDTVNVWNTTGYHSKQFQIFSYIYDGIDNNFNVDVVPEVNATDINLFVYSNFKAISADYYRIYTIPTGRQIWIDPKVINENDRITIRIYSHNISKTAYYEVPLNLNSNAQNETVGTLTLGDLRNHFLLETQNSLRFTGQFPGNSNLRDIDVTSNQGAILQHADPLSYAMMFLTSKDYSFMDAVTYAEQEYTKFKNKFLNLAETGSKVVSWTAPVAVDAILSKINEFKTKESPFFYSDMVPGGSNKNTINYTIFDPAKINYQITNVFSPTTLSNKAVLVYLNGSQLLLGHDYTFLTDTAGIALTSTLVRAVDDVLTIVEYNDTDGSCIPSTPTKLGLYPKFDPEIITDTTYSTPQQFIRGHDGSLTPLFNDFRDSLLLELERRIYNNIKVTFDLNIIDLYKARPGKFRTDDYFGLTDFTRLVADSYLPWVGFNKLNYTDNTTFTSDDPFSYNYTNCIDVVDGTTLPGSWRACYEYFYDTQHPNTRPWEMLGFSEEPSWWQTTYGPAPYTAGNKILWDDLEAGYIAQGDRQGYDTRFARPGLAAIIPVDNNGTLKAPLGFLTNQYGSQKFNSPWLVAQWSPVETAWRNSSAYPYAIQRILALTSTAKYFAEGASVNKITYDSTLGQYINTETNQRLRPIDVDINGYDYETKTINRSSSYINWVAEYLTSNGIANHTNLKHFVQNFNINLIYKMAGYTSKNTLKVLADQNSPNSINSSVIVPDSDYELKLNKSTPIVNVRYSAVIVEKVSSGFKISGYDMQNPYFNVLLAETNSATDSANIAVNKYNVTWYKKFRSVRASIPYGTILSDLQQVTNFLAGYQEWLKYLGFTFTEFNNELGQIQDWELSTKEFLFWVQQGWAAGSVIILSPFASSLNFYQPSAVIDNVKNSYYGSRIQNQNWNILTDSDYSVARDGNRFNLKLNNANEQIAFAVFDLVQYEHALIFNNTTQFNDVIYSPKSGQRQFRLKLIGNKTQGWTGAVTPEGFIYNDEYVQQWQANTDYLRGDLVEYKGFYYTAQTNIAGADEFDFTNWIYENKQNFKTGLLDNFAKSAKNFENFYNVETVNLESDADRLGYNLIGFSERPYLTNLGITDTSQVKLYQGFIKQKGTKNSVNAINNNTFNDRQVTIELNEDWAFRVGSYGATDTNQYVEITLKEADVVNNPTSLEIATNNSVIFDSRTSASDALYNYSAQTFSSPFLLNRTADSVYFNDIQTAGYVNIEDVDFTLFDLNNVNVLSQSGSNLSTNSIIWIAKNYNNDWDVLKIINPGINILSFTNNLNNTLKVTTNINHNLVKNDLIIVADTARFTGYYKVDSIVSGTEFVITAFDNLAGFNGLTLPSPGKMYKLVTQRTVYASNIPNLADATAWKPNDKAWVDNIGNDQWAVYNKTEPWDIDVQMPKGTFNANGRYGQSLKLSNDNNFALVGEPGAGVFRNNTTVEVGTVTNYVIGFNGTFIEDITVSPTAANSTAFGSSVDTGKDYVVVGAPTSESGIGHVYIYKRNFLGTISESQLLAPQSANAESFGSSVAISNDDAWIYVGAPAADKFYAYGFYSGAADEVDTLTTDTGNASYTLGFTPVSTELLTVKGTGAAGSYAPFVDFTVSGDVITFINPKDDTVVVRQTAGYVYVDSVTFTNASSLFGNSIAITTDGRQISVGAPVDNSSAGTVSIYDRSVENYIALADQTLFGGVRTLGLVHKVYVNNVLQVLGTDYNVIAVNWIQFITAPAAGSIVTIESNQINKVQTITASAQQTNSQFGFSTDICSNNCSLYVGSPYYTDNSTYNVGSAYRFVNQGRVYGTVTGTVANATVAGGDSIKFNDYEVEFTGTSLDSVVTAINNRGIPGITASIVDYKLKITSNSFINLNKLTVLPGSGTALTTLGLEPFVETQRIANPTNNAYDLFGYSLKIDSSSEILAVGGPTAKTLAKTTFDVYKNLLTNSADLFNTPYITNPRSSLSDANTTFDGNATRFSDKVKSGAVWILSYLPDARQTINNPGTFAYVQQLDPGKLGINLVPNIEFGTAIDINNYQLLASATADSQFERNNGLVYKFDNANYLNGWDVYRTYDDQVDIDAIIKGYIYNNTTQTIIDNLDYIDPAKGKILGLAEQEITYKTDYDPAVYNNGQTSGLATSSTIYWGNAQIGKVWWDLSTVKYLNYEQGSIKYRTTNWGRVFPGSSVDVYEWVESLYPPSQYVSTGGNGVPKYTDSYVTQTFVDPVTNYATVKYYFWVKGKTTIDAGLANRQLPVSVIADYINDPKNSGVKYFAPIKDNAISVFNVNKDTVGDNVVFHIDYATKINSNIIHSEYALLSENTQKADAIPTSLYNKLLDSTSGIDTAGNPVPDPALPVAKRYGIEFRPRQSMFIDKNTAVQQLVQFVNSVFATTTFNQSFDLTTLNSSEEIPPSGLGYYDITIATYDELAYVDIVTKPIGYKVLVLSDSTVGNLWTIYAKDYEVTAWTANTAYIRGQKISYEGTAYTVTADFTSGATFSAANLTIIEPTNTWLLSRVQTYKTSDYWSTVDWYASYFDQTTQPRFTFNTTADMVGTRFNSGDVVKINNNGQGKWMLLQIFANTTIMVGLQDGTIALNSNLYDIATSGVGFGNGNFDSLRYDQNPNLELRKIITALKNDLFINQFSQEFINLFFVLIKYVLEEQKSVDWVFKTSLVNILQKIKGDARPQIYYRENQDSYQQYIEEVKPYHTTIKEYILDYEMSDNYNGYVSDFDLPAYYDPVLRKYRSPGQTLSQDLTALQSPQYQDWFNSYWYTIGEIIVADGGSGYTVAPTVTITGSSIGDNAIATVLLANGKISKVQVLYPGSYYTTQPTITLNGGNGTGGKVYARLSNNTTRKLKTTLTYDRYTYSTQVTDWAPNTSYAVGDIVSYNNVAYIVNNAFTSGTAFVGNDLSVYNANNFKNANDRIAAYYSPTTGMPGKNPALLQSGISYPGVQIEGALFTDAGGFDVAAFDTEYFDALSIDSDGTYIISDLVLDTKIESQFTDTSLGIRPEDIIIDGGGYVDTYSSHAPEELIPGRVYDTAEIIVSTFETLEDAAYSSWLTGTALHVHEIIVADGGSGYSSNAVVTISGTTGSGATANIVVDANGTITSVTMLTNGSVYTTVPNVTINANTGANANLTFSSATLTARLDQHTYSSFTFRMFKDMNDNWTYLRENASATTTLASNLALTDANIVVVDSSVLFEPRPAMNLPGVVYINGERITYFTKDDATNTLSQLRRSTLGTGANLHYAGDTVTSGSVNEIVPDSYHTANTFVSNVTTVTTAGSGYTFVEGQTYIQTQLWLNQGFAAADLAYEPIIANVAANTITTESNVVITTDSETIPDYTDGAGLYGSRKIQALFVKKQVGA